MPRFRIGVIGIGFGQQVHVPVFSADPRCEVVALCATSVERAEKVAAKLGIGQAYGDWRLLVARPDIDALTIATPPHIQSEIALAALEQGKAVFCEKPLASTLQAAASMAEAAERVGVANMVDFEFPGIPTWRAAKSILERGGIGNLRYVSVSWKVETYANRMGLKSWKTSPEQGGGTLYSFVSHIFYYLEWLAGPIERLSSALARPPSDRAAADTFAVLCLEFESGVTASLAVNSHAFLGSGHRVEFYGDEGTLVLDNDTADYINGFRLVHGTRASKRLEPVPVQETAGQAAGDGRIAAVGTVASAFVDWLETGTPGRPSFRDGLRVQALLEAARRSHENNSWVNSPF